MTFEEKLAAILEQMRHKSEAEELVRSRAKERRGMAAWLFKSTTVSPLTDTDIVPEVLTDEWADSVIDARLSWWQREGKRQYEEWQNKGKL